VWAKAGAKGDAKWGVKMMIAVGDIRQTKAKKPADSKCFKKCGCNLAIKTAHSVNPTGWLQKYVPPAAIRRADFDMTCMVTRNRKWVRNRITGAFVNGIVEYQYMLISNASSGGAGGSRSICTMKPGTGKQTQSSTINKSTPQVSWIIYSGRHISCKHQIKVPDGDPTGRWSIEQHGPTPDMK